MNYDELLTIFCIRNNLLCCDALTLLEYQEDEQDYYTFLHSVLIVLEYDELFFIYFPEAMNTVLAMINQKRFSLKTKGEIRNAENIIIVRLNELKEKDTKEIKDYYHQEQELSRMNLYDDRKDLAQAMSYDMVVILKLKNNDLDDVDPYLFLSSTAYLTENFPDYYKKHPEYISSTIECLEHFKVRKNFLYRRISYILKSDLKKWIKR